MSAWQDRISVDPTILVGKPIIKGTRLAVEFLLDLMVEGWTAEQILENDPHLTADDLHAALHYAAESLKRERVFPLAVCHGPDARGREGPRNCRNDPSRGRP